MNEYLSQSSTETIPFGEYNIEIDENPRKFLSDYQRAEIVVEAAVVLELTTGLKNRDPDDIERYLFGLENGGRALFLFRKDTQLVGFTSCHLLNNGDEFLRFNGATILHAGSGHIIPTEQGNRLWLAATRYYLNTLPLEIQPQYAEGFTQNPRLLKLMSILSHGQIIPNVTNGEHTTELENLQDQILPTILSTKDKDVFVQERCVVKGMADPVYVRLPRTYDEFDDLFYNRLKVKPDQGDFVHFVAHIPKNIYKR